MIEEVSLLDGLVEDSDIQKDYLISIYIIWMCYITNAMQIVIYICQLYKYDGDDSSLVQNRLTFFKVFHLHCCK